MRVKWWSVVPLLVLATGCTPKGIQTPAPVHSEFPHVQEQGTLVVGIKPCRNPADCEGVFSVDPTKFGLLPLNLAIENTSGRPYIFSKTYTEIITSGGRRVPPLYFDQMLDLTQEVSKRERAPLWRRLLRAGDVGQTVAADIQRTELPSTMILANQRYGGFLFFPQSEEDDSYRGATLRIHFRSLTPGEDVTFEFPLS